MPTRKEYMHELADGADALCDWFESQGIEPSRAVAVMSVLIGIIAIDTPNPIGAIDVSANAAKAVVRDMQGGSR